MAWNLSPDEKSRVADIFAEHESVEDELRQKSQDRTPKTGQPTKEAEQAAQTLKVSREMMRPVFEMLNVYMVQALGDHWEYPTDQIQELSTLGAAVMNKNFDLALEKYGAEMAFLGYAGLTLSEKLWLHQKIQQQKTKKKQGKQTDQDSQEDR